MDSTHLHLISNHFPLVGMAIGTLTLIYAMFAKTTPAIKNVALMIIVLSALTAIPAYFSGEGAEDTVENIAGINERYIEKHEDSGKLFAISIFVIGAFALLLLIYDRLKRKENKFLGYVFLLGCIIVCAFAINAGNTGGEIRHNEIRSGYSPSASADSNAENNATKADDGDDD
ncbi:MAG: hypothetical protein EOO51_07195 [Flavobacterium sp.]|nr:MAG: hypothetical protein EOO51_07195 [Flavobacterium sp.]